MKDRIKEKKKNSFFIILALFLLLNPNISVIDYLPDFIAYFILAKVFLKASDRAPFFKEAREAFLKLAWLNLLKLPALIFITWSRTGNSYGNDTITIASFVFAVFELIFMITAINNIFDAFFRLGERSDAASLISGFSISKKKVMTPDALKMLTYVFAIIKCACYGLPDMLLLTTMRETAHGIQIITIDTKYPIVLIISQIIGFTIGIIWFRRIKKYAKTIIKEGQFNTALDTISATTSSTKLESIEKTRALVGFLNLITFAFVLIFELRIDNLQSVNLIPPIFFAVILIISFYIYRKYIYMPKIIISITSLYAIVSSAAYVIEFLFLTEYSYEDLIKDSAAQSAYRYVNISAIISSILLIILILFFSVSFRKFILTHTGISTDSQNYGKLEKEYHSSLTWKLGIFTTLALVTAVLKCAYVISSGSTQQVFTDINDVTMPVITAPSVEWIGFATTIISITLILYSLYFFSTLKDEVKMKYTEE